MNETRQTPFAARLGTINSAVHVAGSVEGVNEKERGGGLAVGLCGPGAWPLALRAPDASSVSATVTLIVLGSTVETTGLSSMIDCSAGGVVSHASDAMSRRTAATIGL